MTLFCRGDVPVQQSLSRELSVNAHVESPGSIRCGPRCWSTVRIAVPSWNCESLSPFAVKSEPISALLVATSPLKILFDSLGPSRLEVQKWEGPNLGTVSGQCKHQQTVLRPGQSILCKTRLLTQIGTENNIHRSRAWCSCHLISSHISSFFIISCPVWLY